MVLGTPLCIPSMCVETTSCTLDACAPNSWLGWMVTEAAEDVNCCVMVPVTVTELYQTPTKH